MGDRFEIVGVALNATAADQPDPQTLAAHGKSLPWHLPANAGDQQPTRATPENAEDFRGCWSPLPAAADFVHGLLAPTVDFSKVKTIATGTPLFQ